MLSEQWGEDKEKRRKKKKKTERNDRRVQADILNSFGISMEIDGVRIADQTPPIVTHESEWRGQRERAKKAWCWGKWGETGGISWSVIQSRDLFHYQCQSRGPAGNREASSLSTGFRRYDRVVQ